MTEDTPTYRIEKSDKLFKGRFNIRGSSFHKSKGLLGITFLDTKTGHYHHCFRENLIEHPEGTQLQNIIKELIEGVIES